jgi:SagB-type dehydrogenase family enzyme
MLLWAPFDEKMIQSSQGRLLLAGQRLHVYNQSAMKRIQLDKELFHSSLSLEEVIAQRRSVRNFSGKPMSPVELSHLLYYSSGITSKHHGFRAAPSAGATYPIEIYPVINNVDGLTTGVYNYLVATHELQLIYDGDFHKEIARAALGQNVLAEANVVLVLSAVFQRIQHRYRERGQRYALLEAGHIAQNTCLVATSMGLGACAIGAFYDEDINRLLGLDGKKESALYLMAAGKI